MRKNSLAHSTATSVHGNKLTSSTKHFWGKKHLREKSQPYELSLRWKSNFGIHEDCFGYLLERKESISLTSHLSHKCLPSIPSRWFSLEVLYPIMLMMVLLTFRLSWGEKFVFLWFEVGVINEKSCLWWSVNLVCQLWWSEL